MGSHEAILSRVPPKLELWEGQSTLLSPSQYFGLDSPFLSPHDLRHWADPGANQTMAPIQFGYRLWPPPTKK